MELIGTMVVGFIVISIIWGAIKGFSSSVKENGPRHQSNFKANNENHTKRRTGELLNFLDSLEERDYIIFVIYKKEERLFTIVYVGGGDRESIDIQIIDNHSIRIDSYQPMDYKGYLGVLKYPDMGKSMYVILSDLNKRYYKGPAKPRHR